MLDGRPEEFMAQLQSQGLRRAWIVPNPVSAEPEASHPTLRGLAQDLGATPDYDRHEGAFFEIGRRSGHLLTAFVHRTRRGQAAGGLRLWTYPSLGDLVTDGLRLSRAMGQKNALAGLWWGGGKGVIARRPDTDPHEPATRAAIYRDYGEFITGLRGCYVTAEDVGTRPEDLIEVFRATRHTTCIPPAVGGSGNPSELTARGVVVAMEAALHHLGHGGLAGKTVALQGLGNVSSFMVRELLDRGVALLFGTDIDPQRVEAVRAAHPSASMELLVSPPGDTSILSAECDVLVPNAVGAVLNPMTIPTVRAPVVCGAANNQLARVARDGRTLAARGVLFVPDFVANRMGIVGCANEQYGCFPGDPAIEAHLSHDAPTGIFQRCLEIFRRADASQLSTAEEAEKLAAEILEEPHPIWPDRGLHIIDYLVRSGWADTA